MTSLDVVTVVKHPSPALSLTEQGLIAFAKAWPLIDLRWILVEARSTGGPNDHDGANWMPQEAVKVLRLQDDGSGIYPAMNLGLEYVQSDRFMIINSGDVLLPEAGHVVASTPDCHKVIFGTAQWHDAQGQVCGARRAWRFRPRLGQLPCHQAMIFPGGLASWRYSVDLPIAADQDLKFRLWKEGKLVETSETFASLLIDGVSSRALQMSEVTSRYLESRRVLMQHLPRLRSETVALVYLARYATRVRPWLSSSYLVP